MPIRPMPTGPLSTANALVFNMRSAIVKIDAPPIIVVALAICLRIPLNPATDSERIRPPLGAPRRRASVVCPHWPTSVRFRQSCAHGLSFERDLIGVVHEPVKNGVCQRRIADGRMPVVDRELAGHEGGPPPVPIIEQLQQIAAVLVGQGNRP